MVFVKNRSGDKIRLFLNDKKYVIESEGSIELEADGMGLVDIHGDASITSPVAQSWKGLIPMSTTKDITIGYDSQDGFIVVFDNSILPSCVKCGEKGRKWLWVALVLLLLLVLLFISGL